MVASDSEHCGFVASGAQTHSTALYGGLTTPQAVRIAYHPTIFLLRSCAATTPRPTPSTASPANPFDGVFARYLGTTSPHSHSDHERSILPRRSFLSHACSVPTAHAFSMQTGTMTTSSLLFSRLRDLKPSKTETQPQWPDPEASIGTWYRSLGRQECWELCGPGRVSYLSLAAEIRDHLEKHGDVVRATVIWSAYMVGKSKAVANPMVFFCSSSVEARSTVRKEIKSSGVLSRYPCFRTAESSRPPHLENLRQLTLSDRDIVFRERTQRSIARCNNPTGRVITTQTSDSDAEYKCATVGAVLEAEQVLYFTTVAHAFDNKDVWGMEEDVEFEFDLDEDHSDDCYGSNAATVLLSAKIPPPQMESSHEPGAPRPTVDAAHGIFDASEIVHRGSGADELLDYCLLPLDKEDGRIFKGVGVLDTRCKFHSVHPKGMLYHPEDCRVIVYTQQASEGILSETPTFLTAASGTSQEYWTISFAGDLMAGDCGAIAVDTRGMLVGHIVAGDPTSKTALLVPGHQVLQHARNTFASSITLAQALKRCKPVNAPSQADMSAIAREMLPNLLALLDKKRKMKVEVARRTSGCTLTLRHSPVEPHTSVARILNDRLEGALEDILDVDRSDFNLEAVPLARIRRRARIAHKRSDKSAAGDSAPEGSEEDWFIHKLLKWFVGHPTARSKAPLCARCNQPAQLEALPNESSNAEFKPRKNHRSVRIHCVNEYCTALPKRRLVPTKWAMPLVMSRLLAVCTTLCKLRSRVLWIPPAPLYGRPGGFWLQLYSKHQGGWRLFHLMTETGQLDSSRVFTPCESKFQSAMLTMLISPRSPSGTLFRPHEALHCTFSPRSNRCHQALHSRQLSIRSP